MDMSEQSPQLRIRLAPASGIVSVFIGESETAIATSGPNSFSAYVWSFSEIGAQIGPSGGLGLIRMRTNDSDEGNHVS